MTFRLPTEAEWEFAARGGNASRGYIYSGSDNFDEVAWFANNVNQGEYFEHQVVATKAPNELGLYDMSGNVSEWCSDWYGEDYYSSSAQTNPTGPSSGTTRVVRGSDFGSDVDEPNCRVYKRDSTPPNNKSYRIGLRLVLELR